MGGGPGSQKGWFQGSGFFQACSLHLSYWVSQPWSKFCFSHRTSCSEQEAKGQAAAGSCGAGQGLYIRGPRADHQRADPSPTTSCPQEEHTHPQGTGSLAPWASAHLTLAALWPLSSRVWWPGDLPAFFLHFLLYLGKFSAFLKIQARTPHPSLPDPDPCSPLASLSLKSWHFIVIL